jgi:dihydroorotase
VLSLPQNAGLTGKGRVNEGEMSTRLGLAAAPALAEEVAVFRDLRLAEHTGARLHLQKLTTARAVQLVRDAKHQGVKVTADVAVHHLLLTEKELAGYDTNLYLVPPLRTNEDRLALIEGLKDGTLDAIVTDHNPVNRRFKEVEFGLARPGMIAFETAWPLLLRLVKRGVLPLKVALKALTTGPARVLGLDAGVLTEGGPATFVIWDENASWRYTRDSVVSKSKNTPFLNWELQGRILEVRRGGRVVFGA